MSRETVTCPVYKRAPAKFKKFLKRDPLPSAHALPQDWRGEIPLDRWFDTKYRELYQEYWDFQT